MAMIVLLCSTPISVSVCRRRSSSAPGDVPITAAASASFCAASHFAFRLDDTGALLAHGFGLARDCALHLLGDVDVLQLDGVDLHTPALGGGGEQVE